MASGGSEGEASQDWAPVVDDPQAAAAERVVSVGRHAKPAEDAQEPVPEGRRVYSPAHGLSAEPTAATPAQVTPLEEAGPDPLLPGEFVRSYAATVTWKAMLVVADGAFPGLGVTGTLTRRMDELLGAAFLPAGGDGGAPFPVWPDDSGLALDLSVHFAGAGVRGLGGGTASRSAEPGWTALGVGPGSGRGAPAGFRQRHHGVLVIDTLNPQSLYRPFGGPIQPDHEPADRSGPADAADGPDAGVVIVADLRGAGTRVVNAGSLWRHACRTVTSALYDPARPESWAQTREELRSLRHVAYIDPALGLGLVVYVDAARRPWCPLGFVIEEDTVTTQANARMLWP
ncbi:hypothetical protein [Thermomonospora echinospora]|uniref:hypothetical protein n=1 Tax=Thermomonospora echinospora TaxID=1992 RepID=UPI0011B02BAA|nr:hypothetical protein [Thermomonospora echinospora]